VTAFERARDGLASLLRFTLFLSPKKSDVSVSHQRRQVGWAPMTCPTAANASLRKAFKPNALALLHAGVINAKWAWVRSPA